MATDVILTGVGFPAVDPKRAGPGVLVVRGDLSMQFDAGRATIMRMADAGVHPRRLDVLFLTHHHYDHLIGMDDIVLTRWIESGHRANLLRVVAPEGSTANFARRVLDVWAEDIAVRQKHLGISDGPAVEVIAFEPRTKPTLVWKQGDVRVLAFLVRHPPVVPSVGYRIETPDGVVVISGDTQVCEEVGLASEDASLLVHEVISDALCRQLKDHPLRPLVEYHANSVELGALAARIHIPKLVLTHIVPQVAGPEDVQRFVEEVRRGGYEGEVVVGEDLDRFTLGEG